MKERGAVAPEIIQWGKKNKDPEVRWRAAHVSEVWERQRNYQDSRGAWFRWSGSAWESIGSTTVYYGEEYPP